MRFKGTLKAPTVSMESYKRTLHEHLSDAIAHAAFEWLGAVLAEIPVWSGASHATFLQLSREVGYALAISPTVRSRESYGASHGDGEIVADKDSQQYTFTYETTLPHLIYNEFNNANITPDPTLLGKLKKPGPYHFQERGVKAFQGFAATVRLPSPWKSLKVRKYKV